MTIITQHKFPVSVYDPLSCPAVQTDHIFERDEVGLPCLLNTGIDSQTYSDSQISSLILLFITVKLVAVINFNVDSLSFKISRIGAS